MAKAIVATFESRAEAERAADLLEDAGVERGEIEIQSEAWKGRTESSAEPVAGWWEWLFGESDDRGYYSDELSRGAAVLTARVSDDRAPSVRDVLEAHSTDVDETTAPAPESMLRREAVVPPMESAARAADRDEHVIPVVEERLKVGKRPVSRGSVRVYTRVAERPVEEQVWLREEHARVDRRPVDRAASATDEAFRDREIEITETAEEVVVAKEARVVEEVTVGTEVGERVETVRDSVRRTEVEVDTLGAGHGQLRPPQDDDFRGHWSTTFGGRGVPYEEFRPAYGYGGELASDPRYAGREWAALEAEAQSDWERQRPGTWEQFKDAIRYSWDRVRQGTRRAA